MNSTTIFMKIFFTKQNIYFIGLYNLIQHCGVREYQSQKTDKEKSEERERDQPPTPTWGMDALIGKGRREQKTEERAKRNREQAPNPATLHVSWSIPLVPWFYPG